MRGFRKTHRFARVALAIAAPIALAACTTAGGPAPSHLERAPEGGGFTILQDVRVGVGIRSDFQAAVRLLEDGEHAQGIELLLRVTEAAPQLAAAHINLAIAYGRVEDWERAGASAERALELSPRHPVAHNELGMIRRRQGRFDEARASYETSLEIASDFHFARRNLAILCDLFTADISCALEHYEIYAAAVPADEQVGIWLADLRKRAGKTPAGER